MADTRHTDPLVRLSSVTRFTPRIVPSTANRYRLKSRQYRPEQPRSRITLRHRQPYLANAYPYLRSHLQHLFANRPALRARKLRPRKPQTAQPMHHHIRERGKVQSQLIRLHPMRRRTVRKQTQLLLLDAILHLPPRAIPFLVERATRPLPNRYRSDDEPRILSFARFTAGGARVRLSRSATNSATAAEIIRFVLEGIIPRSGGCRLIASDRSPSVPGSATVWSGSGIRRTKTACSCPCSHPSTIRTSGISPAA